MAWNHQKKFVIQLGQGADAKVLTIRIFKSMNDELHARICDEKAFGLDDQRRYHIFMQMVLELEARNKKKGTNPRPQRNQFDQLLNNVMQRMTANVEGINDGAGDGVATHILVEGLPNYMFKN